MKTLSSAVSVVIQFTCLRSAKAARIWLVKLALEIGLNRRTHVPTAELLLMSVLNLVLSRKDISTTWSLIAFSAMKCLLMRLVASMLLSVSLSYCALRSVELFF